jgi:hypothetical protein
MGGACGVYKLKEKFEQGCVENPDGKRPLGRPRCRWEGIKVDLKELCWEDVDWMNVAQDRDKWRAVVKSVIKLSGYIKCGEFLD